MRVALLVAAVLVTGLFGCGRSFPDRSARGTAPATASVHAVSANASTKTLPPAARDNEADPAEEPAWVVEAREDPDPIVRRQAIEAWVQQPGETLDPVTYALVDPDESVRARAEELLEEALARR